jgi:tetratricopeptide (TPR) repeat protein
MVQRDLELLLFLRILLTGKIDERGRREAIGMCEVCAQRSRDRSPWLALKGWLAGETSEVEAPEDAGSHPSDASFMLGVLAEARGRHDVALAWYKRAARLAPGQPDTLRTVARLSGEAGNHKDEAVYLRRAIEADPASGLQK